MSDSLNMFEALRRVETRLETEYRDTLEEPGRYRERRLQLEEEMSAVTRSMDLWQWMPEANTAVPLAICCVLVDLKRVEEGT